MLKWLGWIFWALNFLVCSTLKYQINNEPRRQVLFALWHGQSFPLFFWARHRRLCIFPIEGWRGDVIDKLARRYGYRTVRLKEKGTPLQRSFDLEELAKIVGQGYEAALAVDGPPRPLIYHKAKPGILYLSRKTGVPVVPVGIKMKNKLILFLRWDRYELPLPFSTVEIDFGGPISAEESTTAEELEGSLLRLGAGPRSEADRS